MVIAPGFFYLFEVKNVGALARYEQGRWYNSNGELSKRGDYFGQLAHKKKVLEAIIEAADCQWPVVTRLVFINSEDNVRIQDVYLRDSYLKKWEVARFFADLHRPRPDDRAVDWVRRLLSEAAVPAYQHLNLAQLSWVPDLVPGIRCAQCGKSGVVNQRKFFLVCPHCQHAEAKQYGIFRTICDYLVLHYNEPVVRADVIAFFDDPSLNNTIRKLIRSISNY